MCYGCIKTEEYVTPSGEEVENKRWANRSQQGPFRYSNHTSLKGSSLRATKCAWLSEFGGYLSSSHLKLGQCKYKQKNLGSKYTYRKGFGGDVTVPSDTDMQC